MNSLLKKDELSLLGDLAIAISIDLIQHSFDKFKFFCSLKNLNVNLPVDQPSLVIFS
jgi:hypothetical protein